MRVDLLHYLSIGHLTFAIQDVKQKDFPLKALGSKLIEFRDEAVNGRGFVLLRGLPVQEWSVEDVATAYWGMGAYWGKAQPQNRLHHLLGHVKVSQLHALQKFPLVSCSMPGICRRLSMAPISVVACSFRKTF